MATKDLSRTVIEGGRAYRNSWERRASHGLMRARERAYLDALGDDPDLADHRPAPPKEKVGRWFHDKLAPARRWLRSRAGRPWDDVRAELLQRFDTRTIAGRHVVFDHLLGEVPDGIHDLRPWRRFEFWVDADGFLRHQPRRRERRRERWTAARVWLGERRRIGRRGTRLYWMHVVFESFLFGGRRHERPTGERRLGRLLTWQEAATWLGYPVADRRELEVLI